MGICTCFAPEEHFLFPGASQVPGITFYLFHFIYLRKIQNNNDEKTVDLFNYSVDHIRVMYLKTGEDGKPDEGVYLRI